MISKSDIKYIQSLAHKKFREEEGLFVVEGVKMVQEMLIEYPEKIAHLYATLPWVDQLSKFGTLKCPVSVIDEKTLNRVSQLKTPNEVLVLVTHVCARVNKVIGIGVSSALDVVHHDTKLTKRAFRTTRDSQSSSTRTD